MSSKCLDSKQLADWVAGQTLVKEAEAIQVHLDQCDSCRAKIAELQEDEILTDRLRSALGWDEKVALRERLEKYTCNQYQILHVIGQGAGGMVFKARDVKLNKFVAIKCPVNKDQQQRLLAAFTEARTQAKINHPNVAEVYSLCDNPELPYLVMEYVDGRPVNEAVEGKSLEDILDIFKQILIGVKSLHARNIVHRDLKPGNIMVDNAGRVKILDLGIAGHIEVSSEECNQRTPIAGTPAYIAPEQSRGESLTPAMDVFSLGIILFELLTGRRPFNGSSSYGIIQAIRQSDPPLPRALNGSIPGSLQAVCLSALEKDPQRRYPGAREFLMDLERFMQGEPVVANPTMLQDILEHGVDRHINDLVRWQQDHLISTRESDYFISRYERLQQREEQWVLDSRRISFSQVILHLGAWACVVSAFLMLYFTWGQLTRWQRIVLPLGILIVLTCAGELLWQYRSRRVALVLLMAACLIWPILISTTLVTMEWLSPPAEEQALVRDGQSPVIVPTGDLLEGFMSNYQLLITGASWVILSLLLWRHTRTAAMTLIWTLSLLALATAIFSLWGLRTFLENQDYDIVAGGYLIPGIILFVIALMIDLQGRAAPLAGPAYIISTAVIVLSLTGVAVFAPTTDWLGLSRFIADKNEEIAYSFILNGALFLISGFLMDRSLQSSCLRRIAVVLFWLAPTHILAPVFYLVTRHKWSVAWLPAGWTLSELLLPVCALFFIFASVPKQMKSFFFSGLFYVALSVIWITREHFQEKFFWPITLALAGLLLVLLAWYRPTLFDRKKNLKPE
ncbi:MAG: DUF2157 domain-containing protein [Sedimentisphaerales bacterium]|nr:DUF2157 domain-containing protein [Sedimentisphaerales bacterium]